MAVAIELKPHPAADAFPMMDRKRFEEHKADIEVNGQLEPITICDGMILDGRNRYKACVELGIDPITKEYDGNPWTYAWSLNGARRDLTDLQRGAIKYQIDRQSDTWQADQDAKRQAIQDEANEKRREAMQGMAYAPKGETRKQENVCVPKEHVHSDQSEPKPSYERPGRAERAKAANVSPSTQAKVEWIANKRPDLLEKVAKGELKGSNAIKQIKADERKETAEKVEAATPANKKKTVELGEWWQLGNHKLFCGDTSTEDFRRELPGCELAFADPPYGAGKEGYDDSKFYWKHDYLQDLADIVVVTPGIVSIFEFASKTSMLYKWSIACWISNGMTRGALGFGNWIYGSVFSTGSVFRQKQDFCQVTIKNNETEDTTHTTRKPAMFMTYVIETFTNKGDTVIDPFLGSGQTLLACEAMGRACVGGELDPSFCQSIISRWESTTGSEAVKL